MNETAKIYVAGHRGLVGSAIVRQLTAKGFTNLVARASDELDLRNQADTESFFASEKPEYVFLAAAKVGGIVANDSYPAEFIADNLKIQTNIIDSAYRNGVKKLLFLGSSCIYPKMSPQPIKEEYLLTGELEPTNEWYAVAKIAGIKMCQAYRKQYGFNAISLMPTNLYGPNDNFDLTSSHVLPALLRKFHSAKIADSERVEVWGSGNPRREFLHVDDLASACVFLMMNYNESSIINVGTGEDISIKELAEMIKEVTSCKAEIIFDASKPDGTPKKLLDISKLSALGWQPKITLRKGIEDTYNWFLNERKDISG